MAKNKYNLKKLNVVKFKNWLTDRGAEILPNSSEYETLRFKGRETGILYNTGACGNSYTAHSIECFLNNKSWWGKPINVGRNPSYKKEKRQLIERDGTDCFYCSLPLEDDITLEHLIPLSSGGKNTLANMVLCHEACNHAVGNKTIVEKVKYAIEQRTAFNNMNLDSSVSPF